MTNRKHSQLYRDVMKSERWRNLRREIIADFQQCERCDSKENLQLHHDSYENLGRETWKDVELLCVDCHKLADKEREEYVNDRRVQAWADKVYWPGVELTDEIEDEFEEWLERRQEW